MEFEQVLKQIEDHLVPRLGLDPIEKSLYYNLFRHTRLVGIESGLFALVPLAKAINVSEFSVGERIRSLHEKGCIRIEERTKSGHLVRILLPEEMDGLMPKESELSDVDLRTVDFYTSRRYVSALLAREKGKCFYCLRNITGDNCALDHVVPKLAGIDNSFLNVVACCHECNALKQGNEAAEFLRPRYRAGLLSQGELQASWGQPLNIKFISLGRKNLNGS